MGVESVLLRSPLPPPHTPTLNLMESRTTRFIDEDENTFVIRAPSDSPAEDAIEEEHHQLIIDTWSDLAAAGFLGFKRFGIGVVVVKDRSSAAQDVDHDFETHNIWYAPTGSPWMEEHEARTSAAWLDDQLQTYDPNAVVLILFMTDDPLIRAYAVEGTPTPPQAFKLSRAQYN